MERAERLALAVLFSVILLWVTLGATHVDFGRTLQGSTCLELMVAQTVASSVWAPVHGDFAMCVDATLCGAIDCSS